MKALNDDVIPSPGEGKGYQRKTSCWQRTPVRKILSNSKYRGATSVQKTSA